MKTKQIGIAILIALSITVVFFGLLKFEILEFPLEEKEPRFDVEAWDLVTSYNGDEEEGETILDIMKVISEETYPDPDVLLNTDAFVEWRSFKEPSRGNDVYQVDFFIDTVKEVRKYVWYVDKNTGEVSSGNDAAQELLDQVNSQK